MLGQGMGTEGALLLQPTPLSEESSRAWNPCPDQWEKDGNSGQKQGLRAMQGRKEEEG